MKHYLILASVLSLAGCGASNKALHSSAGSTKAAASESESESDDGLMYEDLLVHGGVIVESPHDWKPLPDLPLAKFLGHYEGKTGLFGKSCSVTVQVSSRGVKWHRADVPALYFETRVGGEIDQDWLIPLTTTTARDDASLSPLAAAIKKNPQSGKVENQGRNVFGEYKGESMYPGWSWMTVTWDNSGFTSILSRYYYGSEDLFKTIDDCKNLKKTKSYSVDETDYPEA